MRAHDRNMVGSVVSDFNVNPGVGTVHGYDHLPAHAGGRMPDGIGDQFTRQQDRLIKDRASAEDLADEQPRPRHLVT